MNPKPFWESWTFWAVAIFLGLVAYQMSEGEFTIDSMVSTAEKVALALAAIGLRRATGEGLTIRR